MITKMNSYRRAMVLVVTAAAVVFGMARIGAQDRLKSMPGFDQYTKMQPLINGAVVSGAAQRIQWSDDNRAVIYNVAGKAWRFDLTNMLATEAVPGGTRSTPGGGRGGSGARGGLEQE